MDFYDSPVTELMILSLKHFSGLASVGPVELGSAGVSMTVFNSISKLFNIPLLSVATSFVAEDISKNAMEDSTSGIQLWLMVWWI